jgi:hypothetical protein
MMHRGTGAVLSVCEEAGHLPISERSVSPFVTILRQSVGKGNPA